ncbi:type II toxin-antitoxin system RelE/ParE family toxin [Sphingorhabdus sp. SMR4y]|uniref:type II toxin-antitoxin system RelE/ParE family toxin n=1 Tax=Sphingorhabdus sp. SMR4y TaxID=2584094 RepID=UPI000B5CADB2|nr:type II toxin-antitoxin system RelE/ParE family toxin [Sphingorhabdus sp. SMR4y]ASK88257.1 toxin ParE1 [Sphingorhabdus sp. SMR4y]
MADLRPIRRAASDLAEIADYTIAEFGIDQARRYRDQLQACFQSLLANPALGRSAEEVAPDLRRIRQQAHVVFYRGEREGLFIVWVVQHGVDFEREF